MPPHTVPRCMRHKRGRATQTKVVATCVANIVGPGRGGNREATMVGVVRGWGGGIPGPSICPPPPTTRSSPLGPSKPIWAMATKKSGASWRPLRRSSQPTGRAATPPLPGLTPRLHGPVAPVGRPPDGWPLTGLAGASGALSALPTAPLHHGPLRRTGAATPAADARAGSLRPCSRSLTAARAPGETETYGVPLKGCGDPIPSCGPDLTP